MCQPDTWTEFEDAPDLASTYACMWDADEQIIREALAGIYEHDLALD